MRSITTLALALALTASVANAKLTIEGLDCSKLVFIQPDVVVCSTTPEREKTYLLQIQDKGVFILQAYHLLLWRHPDAPGLAYWSNLLDTGQSSREHMVNSLMASAEYKAVRAG